MAPLLQMSLGFLLWASPRREGGPGGRISNRLAIGTCGTKAHGNVRAAIATSTPGGSSLGRLPSPPAPNATSGPALSRFLGSFLGMLQAPLPREHHL